MSTNNLRAQELNKFRIEISPKYIKVIDRQKQIFPLIQKFNTQILIEKRTSKVLLGDKNIIYQEQQTKKEMQIKFASLILGILSIEEETFLVYVKSVYFQNLLPHNFKVYQIAQVEFIPLSPLMTQTKQILQIIEKEIFSFSFYFSFQRDLTLSFQDYYLEDSKGKPKKPKNKYFWNYQMLTHLICPEINNQAEKVLYDSEWCIPIIQGYFGTFDYMLKENYQIQVFLIGRRSIHRSGTRFYNRGIDESGKCANFIQHELALIYNHTLLSMKYYSGSVPLFWQQISQLSKIKLTRDRKFCQVPFKKHLKSLVQENQHVILINLLEKKKQNELLLIKQYQYQVQASSHEFQSQVRYAYFDMNFHDKNKLYQHIWEFVESFLQITQSFKNFQINLKTNVIYSIQRGTYRVSCLDCLARTNRFLQVLALQFLYINLQKINYFKESFKEMCLDLLSETDQKIHPFLRYYKTLWEQKGQFQSIIYAGSPSTQGKKTKLLNQIQNTLISVQRYYNQKFIDQLKQKGLDAILYHKNYEPTYRTKFKIPFDISIMTWNVNATDPQKLQDLQKIFKMFQKSDLIVIGIQEMIELSTNNVMTDNTEESKKSQKWKNTIQEHLNNKSLLSGEYLFVQKLQMVGLFLIMFISKKWIHSLKSVHKDLVKTGIKIGVSQKYGNKGGIVIRISIYETSLTFVCAHLAAHQSKVKERVSDLLQIHQKAFQQNKQSIQNELQIDFSDYKFFFGDLNFRLNGQFNQIKGLIQQNQVNEQKNQKNNIGNKKQEICQRLMQKDQLYYLMNGSDLNSGDYQQTSLEYFKLYKESKITFYPTYKLDKSTGQYTLQKNRNPSYCDRILFWKNYDFQDLNIEQKTYTDVRIKGSDHRPVYARFVVNILKQTRKQSQSIILQESIIDEDSQIHQIILNLKS